MKSRKQEREEIWKAVSPFLDLPSSATKEGHAVYKRMQRQVEKIVDQNPMTFKTFFFHYDITKEQVAEILHLDMHLTKQEKKRE